MPDCTFTPLPTPSPEDLAAWRRFDDSIPRPYLPPSMFPVAAPEPPVAEVASPPELPIYSDADLLRFLGDEIGAVAAEVSTGMGCKVELVVATLLGYLALATHQFDIVQPTGRVIGTNRLVLIRAASGAGKSTCMDLFRAPFDAAEALYKAQAEQCAHMAQAEFEVWRAKYKAIHAQVKKRLLEHQDVSEQQADLAALIASKPRALRTPRWRSDDTTIEGAALHLVKVWNSIAVAIDEGRKFVYGPLGKKLEHFNKYLDGNPFKSDRRSSESLDPFDARVTLIVAMTDEPFNSLMTDSSALDCGFLPRSWACAIEGLRTDSPGQTGPMYLAYLQWVKDLMRQEVEDVELDRPRTQLTFTPEAASEWRAAEKEVRSAAEYQSLNKLFPAVTFRFGENVSRTAGMLHGIHRVIKQHGRTEISLDTVRAAIGLEKVNLSQLGAILLTGSAAKLKNTVDAMRDWLLRHVFFRGDLVYDRADLLRYAAPALRDRATRDEALFWLAADGWVHEGTRGARNAKTVILNRERFLQLQQSCTPRPGLAHVLKTFKTHR
jgi:hypothetical protein